MRAGTLFFIAVAAIVFGACVGGPAPIVIHEERDLSVWLKFDPTSGFGHDHPVQISTAHMAAVLGGLRVLPRSAIGGLKASDERGDAVFVPSEVTRLAPLLSQALAKASSKDIATFYQRGGDRSTGPLITSGGMAWRNQALYIMLANARTSPATRLYETSHEVDTRDDPLLPIARYNFSVRFEPQEAEKPKGQAGDRYVDPAKVVVVDLGKLPGSQGSARPGAAPSALSPSR